LKSFGGISKVLSGFSMVLVGFSMVGGFFNGLGGYPPSPQNPRKSPDLTGKQ